MSRERREAGVTMLSARRIANLGGLVVLAASGTYFFVYLYRWEWNRALFAGVLFVATEVALATAALLDRLGAISRRLDDVDRRAEERARILDVLHDTRPAPSEPFAWLSPDDGRLGIFVPFIMGVGVVSSAAAWVVERLARSTARPVMERGLAEHLVALAWPDGGLTGASDEAAATIAGTRDPR